MNEGKSKQEQKQDRLSTMLRENLQKRKAQMRARRNNAEKVRDDIPEDISEQRGPNTASD